MWHQAGPWPIYEAFCTDPIHFGFTDLWYNLSHEGIFLQENNSAHNFCCNTKGCWRTCCCGYIKSRRCRWCNCQKGAGAACRLLHYHQLCELTLGPGFPALCAAQVSCHTGHWPLMYTGLQDRTDCVVKWLLPAKLNSSANFTLFFTSLAINTFSSWPCLFLTSFVKNSCGRFHECTLKDAGNLIFPSGSSNSVYIKYAWKKGTTFNN